MRSVARRRPCRRGSGRRGRSLVLRRQLLCGAGGRGRAPRRAAVPGQPPGPRHKPWHRPRGVRRPAEARARGQPGLGHLAAPARGHGRHRRPQRRCSRGRTSARRAHRPAVAHASSRVFRGLHVLGLRACCAAKAACACCTEPLVVVCQTSQRPCCKYVGVSGACCRFAGLRGIQASSVCDQGGCLQQMLNQ